MNMDNEELDNEELEESESEIFTDIEEKDTKGKKLANDLVSNASDIPLFYDADKRGLKAADYLRIIKLDAPGKGYKGRLPLNSTEETISELYGNGLYNIEACNHRHQVLRTKEAVAISIVQPQIQPTNNPLNPNGNNGLSRRLDVDQLEKIHNKVTDQVQANANNFTTLVTTQTKEAAQREREHMKAVNDQQQNFFASMMAANNQMFQQNMAMMQQQHQMTLQIVTSQIKDKTDPVQMLFAGIMMAKELSGEGGDDTPPWLQAFSKGGEMLGNIMTLAQQRDNNAVAILKKLKMRKQLAAKNQVVKEVKEKESNIIPTQSEELSQSDIDKLKQLKSKFTKKGIDFDTMVSEALEDDSTDMESEEPESGENSVESGDTDNQDVGQVGGDAAGE